MKEADYYSRENDLKVKCLLCPKECIIIDGKSGVCGVRINKKGVLYSLVFEKPIAVHIDPIEKKPLYHFYPGSKILSLGTYGCNLNCKFCQNYDISQEKDKSVLDSVDIVTPESVINICKERNLHFVAFTYNEPTVFFEYMMETAKLCKENDIKTVVVSNGQINKEPLTQLVQYIDAFNIDLKSFNPGFYKKICNGDLQTVLNTLNIISKSGRHLEVTFLLIENFNDNEEEFSQMCEFIRSLGADVVLHISRAFPRYKLEFNPTPVQLIKKFEKTAKRYIKNVYIGNVHT